MSTYEVTFIVVVDADDADDAVWEARNEYIARDDFEPASVVELD